MEDNTSKILAIAANLYTSIPEYLAGTIGKDEINHLFIDLIDELDNIEYNRTGTPLFDIIGGHMPARRKKAILVFEQEYGLTSREAHVLRYLANDRNPTYIAHALGISVSTAKVHKYSIFKKFGIHKTSELKEMLEAYEGAKGNQSMKRKGKSIGAANKAKASKAKTGKVTTD